MHFLFLGSEGGHGTVAPLRTLVFTSLQNENEKLVSGQLPEQFVSPQFVCIVVLQHKSEWMSFLTKLVS